MAVGVLQRRIRQWLIEILCVILVSIQVDIADEQRLGCGNDSATEWILIAVPIRFIVLNLSLH